MSWWNPLDYIAWGGEGTSANEQQRTAEQTRQKEQELNLRRLESGYWTQAQYDREEARQQAEYLQVSAQVAEINDEFRPDNLAANAVDSAEKAAKAVNDGGNWLGRQIWTAVPLWIWIAAAVALFFYFGGAIPLRRAITGRAG